MNKVATRIKDTWLARLSEDKVEQSIQTSIVQWLLGENCERWETFTSDQLEMAERGLDYRYQILAQRYLNVPPNRAYRNLLNRLSSIVSLRQKIKTWVSLSRDRQRAVVDVVQEVVQEMLNKDSYLKNQMSWISQCTSAERLRNSLLLASVEEYCLRSIRNQPLLVCRFVNYLRNQSRSGLTQLPQNETIRILSEQVILDDPENTISLLDDRASKLYQDNQYWEEVQAMRFKVQKNFEAYLSENLKQDAQDAVKWLKLYLGGQSPEAIAKALNLPIKQIYRLREKVTYHAIRVFALKEESDLVFEWLEISPQKHNLGLTPKQWDDYWQSISTVQRQILEEYMKDQTLDEIAQSNGLKRSQVFKEWTQLHLIAQEIRASS